MEDREGGEAIRNSSMTTVQKRKSSDDVTDVSDAENEDPATPRKKTKTNSGRRTSRKSTSLSLLEREERDLDFNKHMLEHLEKSEQRQEEFQKLLLEELRESRKAATEALTYQVAKRHKGRGKTS